MATSGEFNVPGTLCVLSLTLTKTLKCKYYHLHFTHRGTESQNEVTCPRPHINYVFVKASIQYETCYLPVLLQRNHNAFGNIKLPNLCSEQAKLEIPGLNWK